MSGWAGAFRALLLANLKLALRNWIAYSSVFLLLLLLLVVLRLLDLGQAGGVQVALVDAGGGTLASTLAGRLNGEPGLAVRRLDAQAAGRALRNGEVVLAVVVRSPRAGEHGATVDVRYRGAAPAAAAEVEAAVYSYDIQRLASDVPVRVRRVPLPMPSQPAGLLLLPGLLVFNVIQSGVMVAASVFAGYRTSGVMRRLEATGLGASAFVLGHAAATFIVGLVQTCLMLVVAEVLFGLGRAALPLLLVTMLGYLVFLAVGFAISGWVRDGQRAPQVAAAIGMPLILAGLFPLSAYPPAVAAVVHVLPVGLVTDALREIVQGAGLSAYALDLAMLAAWVVALLALAGRVFRWSPEA